VLPSSPKGIQPFSAWLRARSINALGLRHIALWSHTVPLLITSNHLPNPENPRAFSYRRTPPRLMLSIPQGSVARGLFRMTIQ